MENKKNFTATPAFAELVDHLLRGKETGYKSCSIRSLMAAHVGRKTLAKV